VNDNIRAALVNVIKASRQKLSRVQRQKVKPQRWLYPLAAEKRYGAAIRAWLRPIKDYVQTYLKENQEAILRGDAADDSIQVTRLDAVPGKSFKTMIDSLNGWLGQYVPDDDASKSGSPIYLGLGRLADSVFDFNEGQFEKGAKTVLGVEFPVGEIWWPDARDTWANKNYDLIRSDMKKHIGQINDLTEKAVTSGLSVRTLTQQILALDSKLSKHRANFIARDQIGKLNGQITQRRMEECGLELYVWETSGDERVRGNPGGKYPDAKPSHHAMDGRLCRWDDASVYSEDGGKTWKDRGSDAVHLHPGMDYQCRCTATAYWQELVGEADAILDKIEGDEDNDLSFTSAINNQPSNKPKSIEEQLNIKKGQPMSIDEAYQGANPNYGKGEKWEINCPNCVNAFELRCRGYDVEAMPWDKWRYGTEIYNNPNVAGDIRLKGDGSKLNKTTLMNELRALPEGSRCAIIIKKYNKNIGHTFVSVKQNGKVEFYDPQNGEKRDGIFKEKGARGYMAFYRTDNLRLDESFDLTSVVKGSGVK
jgi:SPP1 gp7 family putative phage head morphogenesis protein